MHHAVSNAHAAVPHAAVCAGAGVKAALGLWVQLCCVSGHSSRVRVTVVVMVVAVLLMVRVTVEVMVVAVLLMVRVTVVVAVATVAVMAAFAAHGNGGQGLKKEHGGVTVVPVAVCVVAVCVVAVCVGVRKEGQCLLEERLGVVVCLAVCVVRREGWCLL